MQDIVLDHACVEVGERLLAVADVDTFAEVGAACYGGGDEGKAGDEEG